MVIVDDTMMFFAVKCQGYVYVHAGLPNWYNPGVKNTYLVMNNAKVFMAALITKRIPCA